MKAAQDEASPAALRRKTPEAQDLLLAEREGMLRRVFQKLTTRAAPTLAMAVKRMQQLLESSPIDPRTNPTTA